MTSRLEEPATELIVGAARSDGQVDDDDVLPTPPDQAAVLLASTSTVTTIQTRTFAEEDKKPLKTQSTCAKALLRCGHRAFASGELSFPLQELPFSLVSPALATALAVFSFFLIVLPASLLLARGHLRSARATAFKISFTRNSRWLLASHCPTTRLPSPIHQAKAAAQW